jgi:transcriptional regulator with XRE-family HTH domain
MEQFDTLTVMERRSRGKPTTPTEGQLFLAERIKRHPDMDVTKLAEAVGKPYATVWRWVEDERRPHKTSLTALAKALGCTVSQLYRHPDSDTAGELMEGLDDAGRTDVLDTIAFHKRRLARHRQK